MIWLLFKAHLATLWRRKARVLASVVVAAIASLVVLTGMAAVPVVDQQRQTQEALFAAKGAATSGIWFSSRIEYYQGQAIRVIRVAAGGQEIVPPGVAELPAPGVMYLSPALDVLRSQQSTLAERYPGTVAGAVSATVLPGPRSLIAIIGQTPAQVQGFGGVLVRGFVRPGTHTLEVPDAVQRGAPFLVGAFTLPLIWLLVVMAQAGAGEREGQLGALRLLGVAESRLRIPVLLEGVACSVLGAALGCLTVRYLGWWLAPRIPLGDGVWPRDLLLSAWSWPLVLCGCPLVVAATLWLSLTRAGKVRAQRRRMRSGWSIACAGVGYCLLGGSIWFSRQQNIPIAFAIFVLAFLLLLAGCLRLGTILSVAAAGRIARKRRSLPQLIAARSTSYRPARTAALSVGLTLLVLLAGSLMSFFPLLSDSDLADKTTAASTLGKHTVVLQGIAPAAVIALASDPTVGGVGLVASNGAPGSAALPATFVCGSLSVPDGRHTMPACQQQRAQVLRALTLATHGQPIQGVDATSSIEQFVTGAGNQLYTLIAQPASDADLESFRSRLLSAGSLAPVLTLDEVVQEAGRTTRPFVWATAFVMAIGSCVALLSLAMALIEQVRANHRPLYFLGVAGVGPRSMTAALSQQTLLTVLPPVALASVSSAALGVAFLQMNGPAVPLPIGWICLVALLAVAVAPLAALIVAPQQAALARTPPLDA